jgi:opacity protein-like surface antigen
MKKLMIGLVLASIVLLAAYPLLAEGMTFGVKAGANMSTLIGDDVKDVKWKGGAIGGVFLTYAFSDIFAVQPEVLFTMKGGKQTFGDTTYTLKGNYVEIPVLAKVYLPMEGKFKPHIFAGPALGILVTAKSSADPGIEVDVKDQTKSTEVGILGGVGLEYKMETGCVLLDVRYEVGLTRIAKKSEGETDEPDVKNSVISFMVGYGYAF